MNRSSSFKVFLQEPLEKMMGSNLTDVTYWAMWSDEAFDVNRPNQHGVQRIDLGLDGSFAFLWPAWSQAFRSESRQFGIEVTLDERFRLAGDETYREIPAATARPWPDLIGSTLVSAAAWGADGFPHAITFGFERGAVVVSTGYSELGGGPATVGDGDDLLVMSPSEFLATPTVFGPPMEVMWRTGATK